MLVRAAVVALLVSICQCYIFEPDQEEDLVVIPEGVSDEILNSNSFADAYDKYMKTYYKKKSVSVSANFGSLSPHMQQMAVEEEASRALTFIKNVRHCKMHNRNYANGLTTYAESVNQFTAMSDEEMKLHLGLSANMTEIALHAEESGPPSRLIRSNTPDELCWVKKGYVAPTKNQGSCGSCWAFASTVSIEYAYKVGSGNLIPLSDQEILDCSYEAEGKDGCGGGWYDAPFKFVAKTHHMPKEKDYKYNNRDGKCNYQSHPNAFKGIFSQLGVGSKFNPGVAGMQALIATHGPIAIAMHVSGNFYKYSKGVYNENCGGAKVNHAMTFVGYTKDYFKMKNSWGAAWGIGGYCHTARANVCSNLGCGYWLSFKVDQKYQKSSDPDSLSPDIRVHCKEREEGSREKEHCDILAAQGACKKKPRIMRRFCADTCGLCDLEKKDGYGKKKKKEGKGKRKGKRKGKGRKGKKNKE